MPAGRPRSETARSAILDATRFELGERGFDKFSIDRVALAAGVSKQTVYRWYPSKTALVAECLVQGYVVIPVDDPDNTGDVRRDVAEWMRAFARMTDDAGTVSLIRAAAAASVEDPDIAHGFQTHVGTLARTALSARLRRGEEAGQLRSDASATMVAEVIVGALIHRLFANEQISAEFADQLTEMVFDGIARD